MSQKKEPKAQPRSVPSEESPKFLDVESRVFTQVGKDVYIGRDRIDAALRSLLRDEAKSLQAMRLWEILNASAVNEAYNLALIQSADFDSVKFAKALKHWSFFMMNAVALLAKE